MPEIRKQIPLPQGGSVTVTVDLGEALKGSR